LTCKPPAIRLEVSFKKKEQKTPKDSNMSSKETFVRDLVSRMSLQQKIGQCVVVGMSGSKVTNDLKEAITRYQCGGLRLSPFMRLFRYFSDDKARRNTMGEDYIPSQEKINRQGLPPWVSPEDYASTLNGLRELAASRNPGIPLHMVMDQEGDTSRDFTRGGVVQFPSSMGLAASGNPDLVYRTALATAKQMKASGFDMIHSPVVDVNINPDNPEIGRRAFSDDPDVVAELAIAQVKGFKDGGVIAAAKHFPGRGDSATDAHHACPSLDVSLERMNSVELLPYKKLIASGVLDSIMLAHCLYPGLDDKISTVSRRIVTGLLREELGFEGLITTDSMTMGALIDKYGVGESCAMALEAGADVILMKAENQWRGEMFYTIEKFVKQGRITVADLEAKVTRLLNLKYEYGLFENMGIVDASRASEPYSDPIVIETAKEAARKAIMICKDTDGALPLDKSEKTLLINQQFSVKTPNDHWDHPSLFQEMMESDWPDLQTFETAFGADEGGEKEEETAFRYASDGNWDRILLTNFYDRSARPSGLAKRLIEAGLPVILITNTPYSIKGLGGLILQAPAIVLNMNLSPEGLRTTRELLFGRLKGEASWPLKNYNPLKLESANLK